MQITVAAVGTRLEPWVYDAFDAYRQRLPRHLNLAVEEVPVTRRTSAVPAAAAMDEEGERLLRHVRPGALTLALDERGQQWSSRELAAEVEGWLARHPHVAILIGGPDGLAPACRERANRLWSLSRLTFPHALVRVLLAEQLYRAWTILQGHPYHRD
ncbi:MAG: 23S rRNA (pseudouridine(1915)-N(3))-methyltransferase RlmH [Gammaproteobacteria bacterium]|nr:23S rRNA (pseudouridine(1915)-N(3))-methyltransferase RlmH [Gammaproteobacteria bacterium]